MVSQDQAPITPLTVRMMLACVESEEPHMLIGPAIWGSYAASQSREWLQSKKLVDHHMRPTDLGAAWAQAIVRTRLPEALPVK